jgi:hypothetical protein
VVSDEGEDRTKNIAKNYICFLLFIVDMTRFRGEVSEGQREWKAKAKAKGEKHVQGSQGHWRSEMEYMELGVPYQV